MHNGVIAFTPMLTQNNANGPKVDAREMSKFIAFIKQKVVSKTFGSEVFHYSDIPASIHIKVV